MQETPQTTITFLTKIIQVFDKYDKIVVLHKLKMLVTPEKDIQRERVGCDKLANSQDNHQRYTERKYADTTGTVMVPWASHFQC